MLADEINRASPKTQAALLEVMEEGQVTVDGVTHGVPRPFMVIATQNPIEQAGTYRLPEAQLDRFLMKASVGYPDAEATEELLMSSGIRDRAALLEPVVDSAIVHEMSQIADRVYVDRALISYVRQLAEASRELEHVRLGLSARGCLALIRVAKTWAAADGRTHVVPQDVVTLASPVLCHRLILDAEAAFRGVTVDDVVRAAHGRRPGPPGSGLTMARSGRLRDRGLTLARAARRLGRGLVRMLRAGAGHGHHGRPVGRAADRCWRGPCTAGWAGSSSGWSRPSARSCWSRRSSWSCCRSRRSAGSGSTPTG